MTISAAQRAIHFHSLHTPEKPLALSNAWDVASALIAQQAGAPAIATTSAGVAWTLGFADGNRIDRESAVAAVGRIVSAVQLPVTADIEGGLAEDAAGVHDTVAAILVAGAVGINIEDGPRSPEETVERIRAARAAADEAGIDLYINLRTDVFLRKLAAPEKLIGETLRRAESYLDAGASGIFALGATDPEDIRALAAGIQAPLNVAGDETMPDVAALGALGVSRVSLGSSVAEAVYGLARRAAEELYGTGTYESVRGRAPYSEINALFG